MQQPEDLYVILGLDPCVEVDQNDIKKAYKKKALEWHPDKNVGNEEFASGMFKKVGEAYEVLSDPQKRAVYDKYGTFGDDMHARWPHDGDAFDEDDIFAQFFARGDPMFFRPREPPPREVTPMSKAISIQLETFAWAIMQDPIKPWIALATMHRDRIHEVCGIGRRPSWLSRHVAGAAWLVVSSAVCTAAAQGVVYFERRLLQADLTLLFSRRGSLSNAIALDCLDADRPAGGWVRTMLRRLCLVGLDRTLSYVQWPLNVADDSSAASMGLQCLAWATTYPVQLALQRIVCGDEHGDTVRYLLRATLGHTGKWSSLWDGVSTFLLASIASQVSAYVMRSIAQTMRDERLKTRKEVSESMLHSAIVADSTLAVGGWFIFRVWRVLPCYSVLGWSRRRYHISWRSALTLMFTYFKGARCGHMCRRALQVLGLRLLFYTS